MNFLLAVLLMLQTAPATGSISGTVVLAGSAAKSPMDSARVELSGGPALPLVVRTDSQGQFAFANLPPGGYRLRVTKDGYLRQEYAKRASIVIKPDVPHKSVVFEMEPAPTMAGRVTSEYGEPIGNILVQALKAVYDSHGKRTFTVLASTLTDDLGDYRLYWLDTGDYIISASYMPPVKTPSNPIDAVARVIYANTYYPIASDIANARRIPLKADQNVLALDFRLTRVAAVTVRGSISITGAGRGASIAVSLALSGDTVGAARYSAKSNALGDFEIPNVAPGDYIASAESVVEKQRVAASTHVMVKGGRDENSVSLKLSSGVPVLGRIALDTSSPVDWSTAQVNLTSVDPYLESFTSPGVLKDGQFPVLSVQPGIYSLDVTGLSADLYIKAERSGQTNLLESSLGVAWESPAPMEIVLASEGARIEGTVADHAGQLFAGAQVVLVPNADRRNRPDQYRVATSDEEGKFSIRGIPPGEFQLFAWENVEERAWLNSEFMASYLGMASPFTVPPASAGTIQHVPLIPEKR